MHVAHIGSSLLRLPRQLGSARRVEAASESPVERGAWWVWALAGTLFLVYTTLSVTIHQRMLSNAYDLGIFEQVVRSYANGHLPVSELKAPGFPVLGDHFSPVLALVAPFYWVWRTPVTLLVVQAALIAASVLPLTFWARRSLGTVPAAVIGVTYGLSWGVASAVGFDFHEVAFAVPLLACSLSALGTGRPRAAVWWALPLLLVKEDLGLTVAAIGLVIAGRGDRKLGHLTAGAGVAGSLLAVLVILPAFNPGGSYAYWSYLGGSDGGPTGVGGGLAGVVGKATIGLITPEAKATTLVLLLAPTLFLALRSSLLWVAVPTMLWRFLSSDPAHWGTGFHYSLVPMPIVFAAFVEALAARRGQPGTVRRYTVGAAAICLLMLPQFPFWQLVQPATWHGDPRLAVAGRLMNRIPDGATVQASNQLVPHLTNRTTVGLFGWEPSRPDPQWILVDTWTPLDKRWPLSADIERNRLNWYRAHGYHDVADQDGYVLLTGTLVASPASLNGIHRISTGSRALDDLGGFSDSGAQLITWALHGDADEKWIFTQQADGSYTFTNEASGLCADVEGASTAAGARVIEWSCTGSANQRWMVTSLSGGGYTIGSVNSGLLLTATTGPDGPQVTQESNADSTLQHWNLD